MKIDIAESLCYSYLRHVKQCWLVQTNWKTSEHWPSRKSDDELESMFREMRKDFDLRGKVFKGNANAAQLMRQAEIDVVGIDQNGNIHALEVAFHENGLDYGGENVERVLKKVLRTYLLLNAYHPTGTKYHVYFVSPKVGPKTQDDLEKKFEALRAEFPKTGWHLIVNTRFSESVVGETLARTAYIADSAELFARSAKLLNLSENLDSKEPGASAVNEDPSETDAAKGTRIQPLVHDLMLTLLEECPTILDPEELSNLMDNNYCKDKLQLRISNLALVREGQQGRKVGRHSRYWSHSYAGKYYVCSEWPKKHHSENAESLSKFSEAIARRKRQHPDVGELESHIEALRNFTTDS